MGGVCAAEDATEETPVLVQKDMKTVQEEMQKYKNNMEKSEAEHLKSFQRYGTAKDKIQQFKKRHADSPNPNFLNVDENETHHMRGDSFTRASAAASAERFAEFKSKIDEEKRRSRRPIEDHREDVQRKMKDISEKGVPAKDRISKSRERSSKKSSNEDTTAEPEDTEKRDAKRSKSKKRRSGESKKKKDKDKKKPKKKTNSDDVTTEKRSKGKKKKA